MFDQDKFDRDFEKSERRLKILFRVVSTFIAIVFLAIIAFNVFIAFQVSHFDWSHGLHGIVNQLWEGKQ